MVWPFGQAHQEPQFPIIVNYTNPIDSLHTKLQFTLEENSISEIYKQ